MDDTDLFCAGPDSTTSGETLAVDFQAALDWWAGDIIATGGAIEPAKSFCYLIDFKKGTDLTPVISQLPSGWCQVPHWGYMIEGHVDVKYSDDSEDAVKTGDIFYFKPGHTAVFAEDKKLKT